MNIKLLKLGVSMGMLLSIDIFAADPTVSAESSPCVDASKRNTQVEDLEDPWIELMRTHE
jgi:hypothetical protein